MIQFKRMHAALVLLTAFVFLSCGEDDGNNGENPNSFSPAGMVLIDAIEQSFMMGSASGLADEQPVHNVSFTHDFWMDTTEVTQSDYDELMAQFYDGYTTPTWISTYGLGDDYPAYHVYWGDAVLYCNARSKRDGLDTIYTYTSINGTPGNLSELVGVQADLSKSGYRLPTEAEWEFACRGNMSDDFFWGQDYDPYPATPADTAEVGSYAVWYENSYSLGADTTKFGAQPVGDKQPNAFALYDMTGNLYEWCHDWYGPYDGTSLTDPAGPDSGEWRCLRGGSWGSDVYYLRSTNRTFSVPDYIYYFIGFRVVVLPQYDVITFSH